MLHAIINRMWRDEQGQDLVEYALIVAAVGLALITTVNQLSTAVVSLYSSITQGLTSIGATGQ
jgi:Flp pilus assembly pilin Flp